MIALVEDGDIVDIDIPSRSMSLRVDEAELDRRRSLLVENGGYRPKDRQRAVSPALRAYAAMATSADRGAVRDVDAVERAMREQELRGASALV